MIATIYFVAQAIAPQSGVTIENILTAAVTALAGCVVYLYREGKLSEGRCRTEATLSETRHAIEIKSLWEAIVEIQRTSCLATAGRTRDTLSSVQGMTIPTVATKTNETH